MEKIEFKKFITKEELVSLVTASLLLFTFYVQGAYSLIYALPLYAIAILFLYAQAGIVNLKINENSCALITKIKEERKKLCEETQYSLSDLFEKLYGISKAVFIGQRP